MQLLRLTTITLLMLITTLTFAISPIPKSQKQLPPEFLSITYYDEWGPIEMRYPDKTLTPGWPIWFYDDDSSRGLMFTYEQKIGEPRDNLWSYDKMSRSLTISYPPLADGDIFPMVNSLYVYSKDTRQSAGLDAFRLKPAEVPKGTKLRGDTIVIPFKNNKKIGYAGRPEQFPDSVSFASMFSQRIWYNGTRENPDKKDDYQVHLYVKSNYGKYNDRKMFQWYSAGDMLIFELKGERFFGAYIHKVVPPDEKPSHKIRGIDCRLIGWIELDPAIVKLDKDMKPIKDETNKERR